MRSEQRRCYAFHGLHLCAESEGGSIGKDVDFVLQYVRARPSSATIPPALYLYSYRSAQLPTIPEEALEVGQHERGIRVLQAGTFVYLRHKSGVAVLNPEAGRVTVVLGLPEDAEAGVQTGLLFDLLSISLLVLLRARGYFLLHGAGLVFEGTGYLISAHSGSGKSSLALSLVREGWGYLSDDMLLLQVCGGEIRAFAMGASFRLGPEALHRFPDLADGLAERAPWGDKHHIDVDLRYPAGFVSACVPRVLVFPQIVDQATSVVLPVSPAEGVLHLLGQTTMLSRDPGQVKQFMAVLQQLVAQVRIVRLLAGRDVYHDPSLAAALLAPLAG